MSFFTENMAQKGNNLLTTKGGAQTQVDMTTPPQIGQWEVFGEINPPGTGRKS